MNLTSGTLLERGKYRIISTLGRGGFGITYLAEQVLARRKVCIKEFFPKDFYKRDEGSDSISILSQGQASTMSRFKEKFLKEAQTIAALDHANIIHILDVFEENNTAYYVMEYVEGESLNEVVKHCGAMAEGEAVEYVRQVASALEYLHERKIMHLDIKPGNIMLRSKDNHVVLIDFGLSKHYDEQSGEATSTTPVGVSHGYAPMEQYKQGGVNTFSPETDIYSLGATLYYLLTGQRPPEAASLINDPLEFPQHVSATLRSAITAAMSPSSKQRPASVGKFVAMFNKADVTIVERPITPKKPLDNEPKPKSGRWWLWSLLMVVVIAIVCAVVIAIVCAVVMNVGDDSPDVNPDVEPNGVVQPKSELSLLSDNIMNFDHNKGQGTIDYSLSNSEDVPSVICDESWVTIGSISNSNTIFDVAANSGEESRSATINVEYNGQYFSVKLSQSGKPVLRLKSKESISFNRNKGQGTINYSLTNSDDVPNVTSNKNWVTITSVSKSGTIKFSVAANSSEKSRSATIKVDYKGQSHNVTITQSGNTYKVGDYYNENGKEGIVFEVWDGGRHGKIVSLDATCEEWDSRLQDVEGIETLGDIASFLDSNPEIIDGYTTYANSESDGKANTDKLMSRSDSQYFEAAKWCRDKGKGWYLPAKLELEKIIINLNAIKADLSYHGRDILDGCYWSSTEEDSGAWVVGMHEEDLYVSCWSKFCGWCFEVRAVSAF